MATLDYHVISSGWKSTMPNQALVKDLLNRTKGRLIVMNEEDLFYDGLNKIELTTKIKEARKKMSASDAKAFQDSFTENKLYLQYHLTV